MLPTAFPQRDQPQQQEQDACDEALESMPVDRVASFNGRLDIHQFTLSTGDAVEPTAGMNYSPPAQVQAKVRRNPRRSELINDATNINTSPIPTRRSLRPLPQRAASASSASTGSTPSPTRQPRITRSQTASSLSPSQKITVPSIKSRSRQQRQRQRPQQTFLSAEECVLEDTIPENLILLLVGVNPGIQTGITGFAYAHPTNQFWKLLHKSGITDIQHPPSDTYKLPELYSVGNTNIVARATLNASMLTKEEMDAGVPILEHKIAEQRPLAVCIVGKGIWEAVWRVKKGAPLKRDDFHYGWQDDDMSLGKRRGCDWPGARVFVATTTSGLSTNFTFDERVAIWKEVGDFVQKRREERGLISSIAKSA